MYVCMYIYIYIYIYISVASQVTSGSVPLESGAATYEAHQCQRSGCFFMSQARFLGALLGKVTALLCLNEQSFGAPKRHFGDLLDVEGTTNMEAHRGLYIWRIVVLRRCRLHFHVNLEECSDYPLNNEFSLGLVSSIWSGIVSRSF